MDTLFHTFTGFVRREALFQPNHRLLVAVSGGLDSVTLLHLLKRWGGDISVAHCNFQLRDEESLRDELFTGNLAASWGLPFFSRHFDTMAYMAANRLSTQEAARELRYAWFRELAGQHGFHRIVTAHHGDDNAETMLINLFRGTGMAGIRGMLPRQGPLVRPLLFASRAELEAYARDHGLEYVTDSSNLTDKYTRNFLRLQVMPMLEQQFPGVAGNLRQSVMNLREADMLYRTALQEKLVKLGEWKAAELHLPVERLRRQVPLRTIVFELFAPYGFSSFQVDQVIQLLDAPTGKFLSSQTHRLLKNRNWLILGPHRTEEPSMYLIHEGDGELVFGGRTLRFRVEGSGLRVQDADPNVAHLDLAQIEYPLILRAWKSGDYFYPLGMNRKKKVARFLIDNKVSRHDKEKVMVLESAGRIAWVVGHRIDQRFRIRPTTKDLLRLELKP